MMVSSVILYLQDSDYKEIYHSVKDYKNIFSKFILLKYKI